MSAPTIRPETAPSIATTRHPQAIRPETYAQRNFVVRTAPRRDPLFDDEMEARRAVLAGPFDQWLPFDDAAASPSRATVHQLRLRPQAPADPAELSKIRAFGARFVTGVIEVATGRRTAAQLSSHTAPAVRAGLARDAGRLHRLGTAQRPAVLHSLHISQPADGAAELAAVLRIGNRFRAMAFRLESEDDRWRCVRLQIG